MREMEWTKDVPRAALRASVVCVGVSVVSVLCAYFLAPGDAWTFEYRQWHHRPVPSWIVPQSWLGPTIVYIEISHTIVIAALCTFLLAFAYRLEFVRTAHVLFLRKQFPERKYAILRWAVAACALAVMGILVYFHLVTGPAQRRELYEHDHAHTVAASKGFVTYQLPYLLYLPYSFVNFFCGITPMLAVCLFAVSKDILAAIRDWVRSQDGKRLDDAPDKVTATFKRFYERCATRCGRYSALALALGLFAVFQKDLGVYSTTKPAEAMASLGIQVIALYAFSIVVVVTFYVCAFEHARTRLGRLGGDVKKFADENNVLGFLKDLWSRYVFLYVGLGIMSQVIFPWIPALVKLIKARWQGAA